MQQATLKSKVSLVYLRLSFFIITIIDGDTNVSGGHDQERKQSEWSEVHLGPVWYHIGEVSGDQSVDPAAGSDEVDERVGDGDGEGAEEDAGEVDQEDPPPPVNHLQRNSQHQLEQVYVQNFTEQKFKLNCPNNWLTKSV